MTEDGQPQQQNQQQFKRFIAYKIRIGSLDHARPIFEEDRFRYVELGDKNVSRLNVVGNIIDRYDSDGDTKYAFLTLDDGSGQIKLKFFGEDCDRFKSVEQGQTVLVIGTLRHFNNETYIAPEIIKEKDPKCLLVRKYELEEAQATNAKPIEGQEKKVQVKDKILQLIKEGEEDGGVDVDKIIMTLQDISPNIINEELQKFIAEGLVFEPRPGKVRYLG